MSESVTAASVDGSEDSRSRRLARLRIGVISDTHGFLDTEVARVFADVDLILHAGDIGDASIIAALEQVAPVVAVSGNLDHGELAERLPSEASGETGGIRFVMAHKRKKLMKRFAAGKLASGPDVRQPDLIVFGHDHQPTVVWTDTTVLLNPGSATSPYEEDEMPTIAIIESADAGLSVQFHPLRRREVL
jgi:putative phosphoesterase